MWTNILIITFLCMIIVISIVDIFAFTWIKDSTKEIVKGEGEEDIDENFESVELSLFAVSVLGVLMLIMSIVQLYFVLADGVNEHEPTKGAYARYTGIMIILALFAWIASLNVKDTIDPERDTGEDSISLFVVIDVYSLMNLIGLGLLTMIVVNWVPDLTVEAPDEESVAFDFDF